MKIFRVICCLLYWCCLAEADAAVSGHSRTVIHSDKLVIEENSGIAVYTGNVVSKQETNTLKSDRMVVFYHTVAKDKEQKGSIRKIEVYGHVEIITDKERATSERGYYEDDVFYLLGNVKMYNGKNVMTGQKFIHNNKTGKSALVGVGDKASGKPFIKPKLILQPAEDAS